jgi:hypothetical protein
MAIKKNELDLSSLDLIATSDDFAQELIPAGSGKAKIVSFDVTEEGKNKSKALKLEVKFTPVGSKKSFTHFERMWLTTDKAKKMTRANLARISFLATGKGLGFELGELIGKEFTAVMEIEDGGGDYPDKNRMKPSMTKEQSKALSLSLAGKLPPAPQAPEETNELDGDDDDLI